MPVICTPADLMEATPCLQCLSFSQLKMVELLMLAEINGYTLPDDLNQLLEDSAGFMSLSEKQKKQAEITAMAVQADNVDGIPALIEKINCLQCATSGQVAAITALLQCQFWQQ